MTRATASGRATASRTMMDRGTRGTRTRTRATRTRTRATLGGTRGRERGRAMGVERGYEREWGWTRVVERASERGRRTTRTARAAALGDDGGSSGAGSSGNGGKGGDGDGGGEDGGENDDDDDDDDVVARDLDQRSSAEEVKSTCERNGLEVPRDLLDADGGTMRSDTLNLYVKYSKVSVLAFLMNTFPAVRDRMLADPRFAFKLFVETGADAAMNTAMEIKQRGETFWDEFEFFACDQIAAFAVNTAILTICSPAIVLGNTTRSMRKLGELSAKANGATKLWYQTRKYIGKLPPNVFMLDPKLGLMTKLARGGATIVARGGTDLLRIHPVRHRRSGDGEQFDDVAPSRGQGQVQQGVRRVHRRFRGPARVGHGLALGTLHVLFGQHSSAARHRRRTRGGAIRARKSPPDERRHDRVSSVQQHQGWE